MWQRKLEADRKRTARENAVHAKEEKLRLAEQLTAEAEEDVARAQTTLKRALGIETKINWELLKERGHFRKPKPSPPDYPVVPVPPPFLLPKPPAEPQKPVYPVKPTPPDLTEKPNREEERFQPRLDLLDRLSSQRRQRKLDEAEAYYQEERAAWIQRVKQYNAAIEAHNQTVLQMRDAYKEALRVFKAKMVRHKKQCDELQTDYEREVIRAEQALKEAIRRNELIHQERLRLWEAERDSFIAQQTRRNESVDQRKAEYLNCSVPAVIDYCDTVLSNSEYPESYPQDFELDYLAEARTLLVEYYLPTIEEMPSIKGVKYIQSKDAFSNTPLPDSVRHKLYDDVVCQIALRSLYELFSADAASALDSVVFNGRVRSIDKATGTPFEACILSVQVSKTEFQGINLALVEPRACIKKLKGVASTKLHSMAPVAPIAQMDREDKRFVSSHEVAGALDDSCNLAAMDWEDFEHLIREIFEKEFSTSGGEVKVTQASRDGGVDAVVFDPDPIRGGKIVIQAKRYTNVVGVSAVRDLYGTLMNEGATKGILVTTSSYGPDAYEFAKGKPITLLDGGNLLHLLEKHGHRAKIDIAEARKAFVGRDSVK
jgi:restriction system protein